MSLLLENLEFPLITCQRLSVQAAWVVREAIRQINHGILLRVQRHTIQENVQHQGMR